MVADEQIVLRATALVHKSRPEDVLIAFPGPQPAIRPWYGAVTWSGLAAAIVIAGWLGFDLGRGLPSATQFGRPTDETAAISPFDPTALMLRDFTDGWRT